MDAVVKDLKNVTVGSLPAYWYRTPRRYLADAGTLSSAKGETAVLIAVRGMTNPKLVAEKSMMLVLERI